MNKIRIAMAIAITNMLLMSFFPMAASAASNSLSVNPRRNYTIKPGGTIHDTLTIRDTDPNSQLSISIIPLDFKAKDESGTPGLLLKQTTPTPWSLKPYLTIQKSESVQPGESKQIPLTITLPKNIGAGTYYSAIQYATGGSGATGGNVGLSSSAVTLLFVQVPGQAKDFELLKKFGAFVPSPDFSTGTYKTFFGSTKPKYISYNLQNQGNVVDQPQGSIQITNMFGKQTQILSNINPNHNLVIINQNRRIDLCIVAPDGSNLSSTDASSEDISKCKTPSLWPGRYTAKMDLIYGRGNGTPESEIRATSSFWYLPAWFVIAVVALIAVVIFAINMLIRKWRRRGKSSYEAPRRR